MRMVFLLLWLPFSAGASNYAASNGTGVVESQMHLQTENQLIEYDESALSTSQKRLDELVHKKSRFSSSYFQLATAGLDEVRRGNRRISTYNYLSLSYFLERGRSVSLKPVFFLNTAGQNRGRDVASEVSTGDWYLEGVQSGLRLPGDWGLRTALRVYAPTSQNSKTSGQLFQVQPYLIFGSNFARRFSLDWHVKPSFFAQSKSTYVTTDTNRVYGTKVAELDHFFELEWRFMKGVGLTQSIGSRHQWFHDSPANDVRGFRQQSLTVQSGIVLEPLTNVAVTVALSNERRVEDMEREVDLFREDETEYLVMSSLRF